MGVFYNPPQPAPISTEATPGGGDSGFTHANPGLDPQRKPVARNIEAEKYDLKRKVQIASEGNPIAYVKGLSNAGLHEDAAKYVEEASKANEADVKFKSTEAAYETEALLRAGELARAGGGYSEEGSKLLSKALGESVKMTVNPKNPDEYTLKRTETGEMSNGSIRGLLTAATSANTKYVQDMENFRYRLKLSSDEKEPTIPKIQGKAAKKLALAEKIARENKTSLEEVYKANPDLVLEDTEKRLYNQVAQRGTMDIVGQMVGNSVELSSKLLTSTDEEAANMIFKLREAVDAGMTKEATGIAKPKYDANKTYTIKEDSSGKSISVTGEMLLKKGLKKGYTVQDN
jgi:hypothetical protein